MRASRVRGVLSLFPPVPLSPPPALCLIKLWVMVGAGRRETGDWVVGVVVVAVGR